MPPAPPRLQARSLEELGLVDAPAETEFDNLTRLASSLLGAPVSLLSIVQLEADRQVFKSRTGLTGPADEAGQTPLSHSFCRHVVEADGTLVVTDARTHPLVRDNPSIDELGVVAYLGAPVRGPDGRTLGALCVIEGEPRAWSERDAEHLEALAACATDAVRMKSMVLESEELRREQRDFTYAISHDLKSPLSTLRLLLSELVELEGASLHEDSAEFAALSFATMDRAERLIEDVLAYSRSVGEAPARAAVDLDRVAADVRDDLRGDVARTGARLQIGPLPTVEGDAPQLGMLLGNLVANALKFVAPGEAPRVRVSASTDDGHALLRVADEGIGIAPADAERVFGLFQRLHLAEEYPGSGLGLTLVRRIAANHGGRVELESAPGEGATFTVRLPLAGAGR